VAIRNAKKEQTAAPKDSESPEEIATSE